MIYSRRTNVTLDTILIRLTDFQTECTRAVTTGQALHRKNVYRPKPDRSGQQHPDEYSHDDRYREIVKIVRCSHLDERCNTGHEKSQGRERGRIGDLPGLQGQRNDKHERAYREHRYRPEESLRASPAHSSTAESPANQGGEAVTVSHDEYSGGTGSKSENPTERQHNDDDEGDRKDDRADSPTAARPRKTRVRRSAVVEIVQHDKDDRPDERRQYAVVEIQRNKPPVSYRDMNDLSYHKRLQTRTARERRGHSEHNEQKSKTQNDADDVVFREHGTDHSSISARMRERLWPNRRRKRE